MKSNDPVDPSVRLVIALWPDDAPRGAVTAFCVEHGISRQSFYLIRRRAVELGQAAALEPLSRRPRSSPAVVGEEVKAQAVAVRRALENSGFDHGPISVYEKMKSMGLPQVPSVASLARIFREAGVARVEPRKRPRAAFRRFVYPAPNACWQLDGAEYVIAGGRRRTILQLIDDHSRLSLGSLVARSENSAAALILVKNAIARFGVPQRLLSDNGVAFNPTRRGYDSKLSAYLKSLGVEPITGKPGRPTTQGKNERFHQTLFQYLNAQPLASDSFELQAQVDAFDDYYNNQRPHQGLPGRLTPQQAWDTTPVAEPPRPKPPKTVIEPPPKTIERMSLPPEKSPYHDEHTTDGVRTTTVRNDGTIRVAKIEYRIGATYARQRAYILVTNATIEFFDHQGTSIYHIPKPANGTRYLGINHLKQHQLSAMS